MRSPNRAALYTQLSCPRCTRRMTSAAKAAEPKSAAEPKPCTNDATDMRWRGLLGSGFFAGHEINFLEHGPLLPPARERMPCPFSHMLGWPQRYAVVVSGRRPHSSVYKRTRSSTRPVWPFQAASSHGRLMVATYFNQGTSAAMRSNSSR